MYHAMVDIESLGTDYGSVILSIGAVAFEPYDEDIKESKFHVNIDLADSLPKGFTIDGETFYWWWNRDAKARAAIVIPEPKPVLRSLLDLLDWYHFSQCEAAWSHRFDMELLGAYHKKLAIDTPWGYRGERDIRTLLGLAGRFGYKKDQTRDKEKHHPLWDALRQAKEIQTANSYILKGETL